MSAVCPASDPASKVRATTCRVVGSRQRTWAASRGGVRIGGRAVGLAIGGTGWLDLGTDVGTNVGVAGRADVGDAVGVGGNVVRLPVAQAAVRTATTSTRPPYTRGGPRQRNDARLPNSAGSASRQPPRCPPDVHTADEAVVGHDPPVVCLGTVDPGVPSRRAWTGAKEVQRVEVGLAAPGTRIDAGPVRFGRDRPEGGRHGEPSLLLRSEFLRFLQELGDGCQVGGLHGGRHSLDGHPPAWRPRG